MDEQELEFSPEEEPCQPRPRWQIWGARIAVVIFIALVLMSYVNIARGGL